MSYQVLARKWRPRDFASLIGQEHVVQALSHALDEQRLHHAWLFTGTRGVGKTTLARILAKCLNCAQGVTATPCGECQACVEIDEGRFVDYIELDAASNRRVEEMTQLLEQAVYAPGAGRYKVYTIDEVHMLTGHAFNAMLKTLEEPPAHVKFILATTDPQKIPATVLSRCLQFNLKPIAPPVIAQHLQQILTQENIAFEPPALLALGQAAAGSMRDALSLTDQAIAYSAADIRLQTVQAMLGSIDGQYLVALMQGLQAQDARQLLQTADELHQHGLSFSQTLADWAELLSTVAMAQRAPEFIDDSLPYHEHLAQWAQAFSPDALQLFYTVAIHSRNDLHLAPTEHTGFVMACLRMLTLLPADEVRVPEGSNAGTTATAPAPTSTNPTATAPTSTPTNPAAVAPTPTHSAAADSAPASTASAAAVSTPPLSDEATSPTAAPEPSAPEDAQATKAIAPTAAELTTSQNKPSTDGKRPTASAAPTGDPSVSADANDAGGARVAAAVDDADDAADAADAADDADDADDAFEQLDEVSPEGASQETQPQEMSSPEMHSQQTSPQKTRIQETQPQEVSAPEVPPQEVPPWVDIPAPERAQDAQRFSVEQMDAARWARLAAELPLNGWAAQIAKRSEWLRYEQGEVVLRLELRSVDDMPAKTRLNTVLNEYFGQPLRLTIEYGRTGAETADAIHQAQLREQQQRAEQAVAEDPFIQQLKERFDAQLIKGSVQPRTHLSS